MTTSLDFWNGVNLGRMSAPSGTVIIGDCGNCRQLLKKNQELQAQIRNLKAEIAADAVLCKTLRLALDDVAPDHPLGGTDSAERQAIFEKAWYEYLAANPTEDELQLRETQRLSQEEVERQRAEDERSRQENLKAQTAGHGGVGDLLKKMLG